MKPAIKVRNLDVVFGNHLNDSFKLIDQGITRQQLIEKNGDVIAVHNASLDISRGEICVLMGLSGSGKSSLLRTFNGLNPISRGEIELSDGVNSIALSQCNEKDWQGLRSRRISMVFQKFALMPWLTVLENVAFGLEMQGVPEKERHQRAMAKLELVGLANWSKQYPHELSGGMQQRVGLARAFTMDSDILLMDEPFSALDPLIRTQLQDELIELQQQLNKTIIFVSHDLDEALKIGSKIAIMESGKIIQYDKPENIVLKPENSYVSEFVAHTNPLNVLCGHSLMKPLNALTSCSQGLILDAATETCMQLQSDHQLISVTRQGEHLPLCYLKEKASAFEFSPNQIVVAPPEISMREALDISYHTGQPLLLGTPNKILGMLSGHEFYHALLGKHFQTAH